MRRFYAPVENFYEKAVTLDADETRHLRDVLRLNAGDEISVFDGIGREFKCHITEIRKKSCDLECLAEIAPSAPESPFEITLAATVLNGEKYDLVVQKAVELGVAAFVPLETIRGDVKIRDAARRIERWRRITLEATKQSGRAKLMNIAEPTTFRRLISEADADNVVVFSERDGSEISTVKAGKTLTAVVGPKGGWDDSELASARASGVNIVTLGGRILRAETAAISITAILQHKYGDLR